ncbi:hypothetical protein IF2G_02262 [Cordyceps javanica]|nr:hypothetical protein IF2G_02262 [Cordyceps javanica]
MDLASTGALLKDYFHKSAVLVPLGERTCFKPTKNCVRKGQPSLRTKHTLRPLLSRNIGDGQMKNIEKLFQETVESPNRSQDEQLTILILKKVLLLWYLRDTIQVMVAAQRQRYIETWKTEAVAAPITCRFSVRNEW